jgi:hypothetical protein
MVEIICKVLFVMGLRNVTVEPRVGRCLVLNLMALYLGFLPGKQIKKMLDI